MKTGQRVVCISEGNWISSFTHTRSKDSFDPTRGMVLKISDLYDTPSFGLCLSFEGTGNCYYPAKHFIPLDENWTDDVIKKALQQQLTKKELV